MRWLVECRNAIRWGNSLKVDLFKSRYLGYLILLGIITSLSVGLLLFLIDPNIKSPMDGVWSAWVTMTHVGFGDAVPVSFFGRLLSAGLILVGLVFFSLLTALVSVALLGKNMGALGGSMRRIEREADDIQTEEDRILSELIRLRERMEALEKQLSLLTGQEPVKPTTPVSKNGN
ncbi:MAG: potassium channel family protein [Methylobacter sp.]|jgi:voltage-gated potassium channel|nr:potassium channel family protein [Methylobacter sp.]